MATESAQHSGALEVVLGSYNPHQVARALNLHVETVRDALRTERIRGFRVGNRWRVAHGVLTLLLEEGVPLPTKSALPQRDSTQVSSRLEIGRGRPASTSRSSPNKKSVSPKTTNEIP